MSDADMLTVSDVAARLAVSADTVLALIGSGRLAAVNVGLGRQRPRWRISPESLDAFLAARASPKPKPKRRRKARGRAIEFF